MAGIIGDVNNNLLGLQQLAQGRQQIAQQQKQASDTQEAGTYLRKFHESAQAGQPDYNSLNEAIIRSPDLAKNVLAGIGIQDKRQGTDAANFAVQAFSTLNNPEEFMTLAQNRVNYLQNSGRDPSDTIKLIDHYKSGDINEVKGALQSVGAATANQGYLDKDIYSQAFGVEAPITPIQRTQLAQDDKRIGLQREGLDIQRQGLEIDRLKANAKVLPAKLDAKDIQGIQKDVSSLLSDTNGIHRAAKSLDALQGRGSPLSQTAAVFAFMKSLDPTSAVRETEQGQVYDAQGAASGIAAKLNKLIGEGGLTKEGFQDIVDTSKALADSAIDSSEQQINGYLDPYGDTLTPGFKKSIAGRIPARFGAKNNGQNPQSKAVNWSDL